MIPYEFIQVGKKYLLCYPDGVIIHVDNKSKKWELLPCYFNKRTGYYHTSVGNGMLVHRIVAYAFKIIDDLYSDYQIDHRDRDRTNNCVFNLRSATSRQNNINKEQHSGKGYYLHKPTNKWLARIMINGTQHQLGYFVKEEDAIKAVKTARDNQKKILKNPTIFFPKELPKKKELPKELPKNILDAAIFKILTIQPVDSIQKVKKKKKNRKF